MLRMELLNNIASSPDPLHQVDIVYKRPLAYSKMESLIKEMQDEETGVPVRSQKVFLSSIPAAFAGYDIIEWLMERLSIEDSVEAIHLANLMCQHGYFFPVGTNNNPNMNFSVKTPYYWPNRTSLSNATDTSVDYAIYLSKRTLRNKQKHALDDYELDAYNDLRRCLGHKWDFVSMQADEQVRLSKDRKKQDKVVLDSQERAYWRVVRPPPGVHCSIETPPTFNTQNTAKTIRKTNNILLEDLRNEVDLLRNSCIRTRIKVSCALESLSSHCESYHEHDPILVQRQPSNPWHSDDPTFWILNADVIDVPTERRLKKWAISMEDLIFDPSGVREFTTYLKKEYCHENIRFWLAVRDMKFGPVSLFRVKAQQIFNEFLSPGSPCEINIDMRTRVTMEAVQKELNYLVPSRFTFDPAAEHVYMLLLKKDCYPRYIRSEQYKNLLHQSQQVSLKNNSKRLDKFFSFVVERKKKTSTTDDQKVKVADLSSLHQQENLSSLADNIPYRGDLDNNQQNLSGQNSLDDVCCPWETSSSVKSDRTTSTDRIHRVEPVKQISLKSDKSDVVVVPKQKSLDDHSSTKVEVVTVEERPKKKIAEDAEMPSSSSSSVILATTPATPVPVAVVPLQAELKKQLSKQSSNASRKSQELTTTTLTPISTSPPSAAILPSSPPPPLPSTSLHSVTEAIPSTSTSLPPLYRQASVERPVVPEAVEVAEKTETISHSTAQQQVPTVEPSTSLSTSQEKTELKKQLSRKKSTASSTSSAEICPWEVENGSAPEPTFTKTYSTLGFI
ncbi:regulator of G-protein signaling 7 isoform X2 [Folsomia candida]|uniref:regulator of G-protein signaling 7 isoform X2 n=1 Tax=Folsomia candida TaxID=158441 RepID=UPI0016050ABD|nr:regulator of G-protein signaling 7 isoform X2 [Folsomia candida]